LSVTINGNLIESDKLHTK